MNIHENNYNCINLSSISESERHYITTYNEVNKQKLPRLCKIKQVTVLINCNIYFMYIVILHVLIYFENVQ